MTAKGKKEHFSNSHTEKGERGKRQTEKERHREGGRERERGRGGREGQRREGRREKGRQRERERDFLKGKTLLSEIAVLNIYIFYTSPCFNRS